MWHAAQPVARKFPFSAFAGVHRWQDVHSLRSRSKNGSPLCANVGRGSRRGTAPPGNGWPFRNATPGSVGSGAMLKRTASFVGCSPFGNSDPLCVPERCAMMFAFTFLAIVVWQAPHVCSTTRRSLGLAHMPAWACLASVAFASPR